MKTYEYYQPEYVKTFQCDGQKCLARCCRNWDRIVDKKTYKKYSHLKPKSAAKELTRPLKKIDKTENYKINLDENGNCPFLTEEKLCSIQQKYGEDFVPEVCTNYPRRTWNFMNFYERSLTLTCPVAAEQVLLATEPLKFEKIEVSEEIHSNSGKFQILSTLLEPYFFDYIIPMQETVTRILQERTLKIDQRLLILEFYIDKIDELLVDAKIVDLEKVNSIYQSSDFLQEQTAQISPFIKFDASNHLKIILAILNFVSENSTNPLSTDKKFFDATMKFLAAENNQALLNDSIQKYNSLAGERQKFLERFSTVFENYLVHEFFFNFYPFKVVAGITQNYNIFLILYKLLELISFAIFVEKEYSAEDLVSTITLYVEAVESNSGYIKKISEYLVGKNDPGEILKNMLQV